MNRLLLAFAGAALAACVDGDGADDPNRPGTAIDLVAERQTQDCAFNRMVQHPNAGLRAVWQDRKPMVLRPSSFADRSVIGVIGEDRQPRFFAVAGEVSAVNWRREGQMLEMLINGRHYGLLETDTGALRVWPLEPAWAKANVKNLVWGGLRAAIDSPSVASALAGDLSPYAPFASSLILAQAETYRSADALIEPEQAEDGALFNLGYPAALSADPGKAFAYPLQRPLFDPDSGREIGSISAASVTIGDTEYPGERHGGLVQDAVSVAGEVALLIVQASGAHTIVGRPGDSARKAEDVIAICGHDAPATRTAHLSLVTGRGPVQALWHRTAQSGSRERLAIRFAGGPFGSVTDGFPSRTVTALTQAGYDVLEVDGAGSRRPDLAAATGPQVTAEAISELTEKLEQWVAASPYTDIAVVGESFGTLAASDLAVSLAQQQVRAKLIIIAPLTRLDPDRSMGGKPFVAGSLQMRAETHAFGDRLQRRRLADWLQDRISRACDLAEFRVFVGANDQRVPASQQASCVQARQTVIEGRGHSDVSGDSRVWEWSRRDS